MQNKRVNGSVIALAVAIPLAILLGIVFVGGGDEGNGDPTTTTSTSPTSIAVDEDWNETLAATIRPLADVLPRYAADVDAWSTGERTADELTATLDELEPVLGRVRVAVDDLAAHPHDELAQPLIADSLDLYVAAFDAHRLALAATGDVATQYDLLGRRLRILGDRAFDRARERTSAPLESPDGVTLNLPAEVPDWTRLGLAVGPPLETDDTNEADATPRPRDEDRESQSDADWRKAVDELDPPTVDDVRADTDDTDALGTHARRLIDAAEALRDVPVPDGDRGRADRLALGWLVLADAARAAQLDTVADTDGSALTDALLDLASRPEIRD